MIRGIYNISIPATISHAMAQGRKMSLPVDPASLIYSHFQHVSGTAAPQGTYGVTISKLNLLDVLIEQLNKLQKGETPLSSDQAGHQEAQNIDALIETYRNQIQQIRAASLAMPYIQSPSAQSGAVFSLTV